jgi:hypothetical protein
VTDLVLVAYTGFGSFLIGMYVGSKIWDRRRARLDTICPTCLGPTNADGIYEKEGSTADWFSTDDDSDAEDRRGST